MEQVQTNLLLAEQIVGGVLISALFALLLKYALKGLNYLESKDMLIKDTAARKIFDTAIEDMKGLIKTNITSAETTLKPAILQAIADGKVDKSELSSLATLVNNNVLKQLGTDSLAILNKNLGDLNSYLPSKTEEILAELKADPTSVVSKTVIPDPTPTTSTDTAQTTLQAENDALKATVTTIQANADAVQAKNDALNAQLASIQSAITGAVVTNVASDANAITSNDSNTTGEVITNDATNVGITGALITGATV
jgi:hypothetical protein